MSEVVMKKMAALSKQSLNNCGNYAYKTEA